MPLCHAIPVMRKQAGAAQKWAHTMCRLGLKMDGMAKHYIMKLEKKLEEIKK